MKKIDKKQKSLIGGGVGGLYAVQAVVAGTMAVAEIVSMVIDYVDIFSEKKKAPKGISFSNKTFQNKNIVIS